MAIPRWRNEKGITVPQHGNASRFPPPHPLGEKHPADHPRDEVRRSGAVAPRAGSRDRCSPICQRTFPAACAPSWRASRAGASAAGQARQKNIFWPSFLPVNAAWRGLLTANILRKAHEFFARAPRQETLPRTRRQKGTRFAETRGLSIRCRIRQRSGQSGILHCARNRRPGRRICILKDEIDCGLFDFQRIQDGDDCQSENRKIAPRRNRDDAETVKRRTGAENSEQPESQIDYIYEQPSKSYSLRCCQNTSKRKSFAPCWNLQQPSTPRAWRQWNPRPTMPAKSFRL